MKKVVVTFTERWSCYQPGDRAGFTEKQAADLIRSKYARPFAERAAVTKSEPEPAKPVRRKTTKKKAKKKKTRSRRSSRAE